MPHWFPFANLTAPLSPSFPRLSKKQVLELKDALTCVDQQRHLYVRTHRSNVVTEESSKMRGGLLSSAVQSATLSGVIAAEMRAHA